MAWGVPKIGSNVIDATGNFDLIEPAGVAEGDLMVACIAMRGTAVVTAPTGWSIAATQQNSGDTDATDGIASAAMFYIVRGSSAPALTCTRTAGDVAYAKVISYSGGRDVTANVLDTGTSATQGSAGNTPTTGTITTAEAGELIVSFVAYGDQYTVSAFDAATDPATASGATDTTTAPTNGTWIERFDANTNTGADTGIGIADAVRSAAGATGTIQATVSSASGRNAMMAAAFKLSNTLSINTSDSITVNDGVVTTASYSESNRNTFSVVGNNAAFDIEKIGDSFIGDGRTLSTATFFLLKTGTPTGNATASIYAHTGTFGSGGTGTGPPLATSDTFDVSTLTGSYALITFTFSGANRMVLTASTEYVVAFEYDQGNSSNYVQIGADDTSPTYAGNGAVFRGGGVGWSATSTDYPFYLNTVNPVPELVSFANKSDTTTITDGVTKVFGTETIVGSIDGGAAGFIVATKYTLPTSGTVNKLSVYTATSGNTKGAIYADSGGSPGARLTFNNVSTAVTGGQWNDVAIPSVYLAAGTYWIAFNDDTGLMRKAIATAGGSNKAAYNNVTYAAGCPDPFPSVTFQDYDYVAYATYVTIQIEEATSDPSVNKSDTITVTESVSMFTDQLHRSVSDTITVTESVGRLLESYVNKSDNITITENKVVDIPLTVNVSDSLTITESTKTELNSSVNKSDSITITESHTELITELFINKSENITVTESIGRNLAVEVNKTESITVTENADPELVSFVNKSENITLTESVNRELGITINKSENITVTEAVTRLITELHITKSESITISESIGRLLLSSVTISENVAITEAVTMFTNILYLSVNDTVTTTESVTVNIVQAGVPQVSVSDTATITEAINLLIPVLLLQVSDNLTATESVTVNINATATFSVNVSDTVTVTESVSVSIQASTADLTISKSDTVTVSESVNTLLPIYNRSVSDNITLTEAIQIQVSDPVPPLPYRLLRGPRGTLVGPKQNNFIYPRRGPRQIRPPRSY